MRTITYAQAIKEAIAEEMRRDPSVILYGEDVANFGGIFKITAGLKEEFGEERVFDTPISENAIVGAGVGAAITGLRPIVELQFADFLFTAADEIVLKAGMWRYVHGGAYTVPMVVRCPSGAAGVGPEHGQCPEAFFMHTPGLRIVSPSTPADAKGLLKSAIRSDDPVLYFEHKLLYATKGEVSEDPDLLVPMGKAAIRHIDSSSGTVGGRSLAAAGWVLGVVATAIGAVVSLVWVVVLLVAISGPATTG